MAKIIKIDSLAKQSILSINVVVSKEFKIRCFIALKLFRLGMWLLGGITQLNEYPIDTIESEKKRMFIAGFKSSGDGYHGDYLNGGDPSDNAIWGEIEDDYLEVRELHKCKTK